MEATTRLILSLIRGYQVFISPLMPPTCRYQPTCSTYALEAVERFGPWQGGWMAIRRVLRCHPLHPGGYNPVPRVPSPSRPPTSPISLAKGTGDVEQEADHLIR